MTNYLQSKTLENFLEEFKLLGWMDGKQSLNYISYKNKLANRHLKLFTFI